MTKHEQAVIEDLLAALELAARAIEANDLDEAMAGEYEIITDAIALGKGAVS